MEEIKVKKWWALIPGIHIYKCHKSFEKKQEPTSYTSDISFHAFLRPAYCLVRPRTVLRSARQTAPDAAPSEAKTPKAKAKAKGKSKPKKRVAETDADEAEPMQRKRKSRKAAK